MTKKSAFPFDASFNMLSGLFQLQKRFPTIACLHSCAYTQDEDSKYQFRIAAGEKKRLQSYDTHNAFKALESFAESATLPVFGILSYDLKNHIHNLQITKKYRDTLPMIDFFEPEILIDLPQNSNKIEIHCCFEDPENIYRLFLNTQSENYKVQNPSGNLLQYTTAFELYQHHFNKLITHIEEGDVYEINYCIKCAVEMPDFNGYDFFRELSQRSEAPFSAWLRIDGNQLVSASPERFLQHTDGKLLAQPIKGTAARYADEKADLASKEKLRTDKKERAENVMIVDLMRNDLAKVSKGGSVYVSELFGIYPFRHVYQMISSVRATLNFPEKKWIDALEACFPMGSMTGAPKKKAIELIDRYEKNKRGWYSGAAGYIEPNGNFDFNVVIRSLLYEAKTKQASFQVGSAVTYDAQAQLEWQECLLKGKNLKNLLEGGSPKQA